MFKCFSTVHDEDFIQLFKSVLYGVEDIFVTGKCIPHNVSLSKIRTYGSQMETDLENTAEDVVVRSCTGKLQTWQPWVSTLMH